MPVAAVHRDPVTAAFLERPGGYCTDGKRLFRVLAIGTEQASGVVLVEDCAMQPPECAMSLERRLVKKMRVVKWPPGLDL
jgi:hypothetical protein